MATKKNISKQSTPEKTTMVKIAEKVGEVAGKISVKKDHLVDMATGAIDSVKSTIHNISVAAANKTAPKKTAKAVVKKVVKKAAKKITKSPVVKKAATAKKAVKKAVKKAPAAKKAIKKVVKRAAKKITGKKK
ncbi:MAG: hypothetical protein ABI741_06290 [Ferruginibacter sp.]